MCEKVKPKLIQSAEHKYMCECGYKLYVCPKDRKPNYCSCCGKEFNWSEYLSTGDRKKNINKYEDFKNKHFVLIFTLLGAIIAILIDNPLIGVLTGYAIGITLDYYKII